MSIRRVCCYAAFAPLLLIASGAESAIYRCAQPGGAVLYSDVPCDGAKVVDIYPGSADPNAKERLARVQSELDRAAADRRAREQVEEAHREALRREAAPEANAPGPSGGGPELYGTAYDFYAPYALADPLRNDRHRGASAKFRDREKRVPQVVRTPHAHR
jgi:hypothetical protein